jgi:outer membrane receptor protein involved in Fe transport
LLPRIRVSFPVSDNQVLFFNYGHSISWPNAYQVYSGLDLTRQDRSYLSRVGNPALRPETTVEYELGLRSQFSTNDVFTVTAFSKDKFDYVVRRYLAEIDKSTYVNEDYARINGIEVTYLKRIGRWFTGSAGNLQVARGSNRPGLLLQIRDEGTKEVPRLGPTLGQAAGTSSSTTRTLQYRRARQAAAFVSGTSGSAAPVIRWIDNTSDRGLPGRSLSGIGSSARWNWFDALQK